MDRTARDRFGAVYLEAEVSAHSPRMQRTLERLGFVAVAYCPSMVFHDVELLDVIRMAKLTCSSELGPMRLLDAGQRMKEIVEHGLEDQLIGLTVTEGTRRTDLFRGPPEGELHHLARIAQMVRHEAGAYVVRQGDGANSLYIMLEGGVEVRHDGARRAIVSPGDVFGEMALVEKDGSETLPWTPRVPQPRPRPEPKAQATARRRVLIRHASSTDCHARRRPAVHRD